MELLQGVAGPSVKVLHPLSHAHASEAAGQTSNLREVAEQAKCDGTASKVKFQAEQAGLLGTT